MTQNTLTSTALQRGQFVICTQYVNVSFRPGVIGKVVTWEAGSPYCCVQLPGKPDVYQGLKRAWVAHKARGV